MFKRLYKLPKGDKMKTIKEFSVSYRVDASSYYQGCSTVFTDWDIVQVGIGDSQEEALEDAIECIAMSENISNLDILDDTIKEASIDSVFQEIMEEEGIEEDTEEYDDFVESCEVQVYAELYVKFETTEVLA